MPTLLNALQPILMSCLLLLTGTIAVAQTQGQDRNEGEWWTLQLAAETFRIERVAEPENRRQGLMGRTLARDEGMLFDFPAGTVPAIWMRNMHISLDLIYVDDRGQIANIFADVPPCRNMPCDIYRAEKPLRFVLELPDGTAARLGLTVGQQLQMDEFIAVPVPAS